MSGVYRQIYTEFWSDPAIVDSFSPEDRYFYLYLMTNAYTSQCGIYQISLKQIAFDTGYSMESVKNMIERFQSYHKRILYNPETHELAVLNHARYNYPEKISDNRFACIKAELAEIKDRSMITPLLAHAPKLVRDALADPGATQPPSPEPVSPPLPDPLSSPLEAPSKPLGEEEEREEEQEGENTPEREETFPDTRGEVNETIQPHFRITAAWFKRFNKITGITTMPDERSNLAAKKLLEFLGGDIKLALQTVDYYFDNWRDLWFACDKATRKSSVESRKCEFRFGSFATPENIQEIVSKMKTPSPVLHQTSQPWSTASPVVPDDELASPAQRAEALKKFDKIKATKKAENVA